MKLILAAISICFSVSSFGFQTGHLTGQGRYKDTDGNRGRYDIEKHITRNDDGTMTIDTTMITEIGESHSWSMVISPEEDGFFTVLSNGEEGREVIGDGVCFKSPHGGGHHDGEHHAQASTHHPKICTYTTKHHDADVTVSLKIGYHGVHYVEKMVKGDTTVAWKQHLHR